MSQVIMPQRRPDTMTQMLPIAATAVGTAIAGPAGGAAGNAIGSTLAASGQPGQVQASGSSGGSAIDRRLELMKAKQIETQQLAQAQVAVQQLPPPQRIQYEQPINEALMRAQQQGYA